MALNVICRVNSNFDISFSFKQASNEIHNQCQCLTVLGVLVKKISFFPIPLLEMLSLLYQILVQEFKFPEQFAIGSGLYLYIWYTPEIYVYCKTMPKQRMLIFLFVVSVLFCQQQKTITPLSTKSNRAWNKSWNLTKSSIFRLIFCWLSPCQRLQFIVLVIQHNIIMPSQCRYRI